MGSRACPVPAAHRAPEMPAGFSKKAATCRETRASNATPQSLAGDAQLRHTRWLGHLAGTWQPLPAPRWTHQGRGDAGCRPKSPMSLCPDRGVGPWVPLQVPQPAESSAQGMGTALPGKEQPQEQLLLVSSGPCAFFSIYSPIL